MFVNLLSLSLLQWDGCLAMFVKFLLFQSIFSAVGWMNCHVF